MATTLPRAGRTLIVNSCPIERRGLVLAQPDRWLDQLTRPLAETDRVPGFTGGRVTTWLPGEPRDIGLAMTLVDVTEAELQRSLADVRRFLAGPLELEWPHAPGFVQRGYAGPLRVEPMVASKAFVMGPGGRACYRVNVTIRCPDSVSYARHPRRVKLDATPRPIVLGSEAVGGVVLLQGPVSGAVDLDLLAPNGALLERLALRNVSLATGDVCAIRLDAPHTITKRTAAGVTTSVYAWRSLSLSTGWWHVLPRHADPVAGLYPLARLSAGTGLWTYTIGEAS